MEIRNSTIENLDKILKIYEDAREFMKTTGNPNQWSGQYPGISEVKNDIENKTGYVCLDEGQIVGVFMYTEGQEPTYEKIYEGQWLNDEPYGVVHRIAAAAGKKGVATFCLNWCYDKSKNIRIDTHRDNMPMRSLLSKMGFVQCGIVYLKNGDERIAYHKA